MAVCILPNWLRWHSSKMKTVCLSSTLREKENVVSSMFTVPITMRFLGKVNPFVWKCSLIFNISEFVLLALTLGNKVSIIMSPMFMSTSFSSLVVPNELNGLMIGSVMYSPPSKLRLSMALRNSAKYSSTGARFISSRHKKNGTSGCCHALTINSMKGVNT